jgi:hypothetical protein
MSPSPLGATLQRARLDKGLTLEDAERVTRIPKKYLEALESEDYGRLPAPVYARGFLRSYSGYLGLEPNQLMPMFPVGHVDEPQLDPLPQVNEPRTWNMNGVVAMGVIGLLILLVVGLYSLGQDDGSPNFGGEATGNQGGAPAIVPEGGEGAAPPAGPAASLPDLVGLTADEAIGIIEGAGASYIVVGVREGDVPVGQVVSQDPEPGTEIGAGDLVTLGVSQ